MTRHAVIRGRICLLVATLLVGTMLTREGHAQQPYAGTPYYTEFLVPPDQSIAIRAGRLFDATSERLLLNQVVLIRGDRIENVGANLPIPPGARVIDLSQATVMPGMIDAHVHVMGGGDNHHRRQIVAVAQAQKNLMAGFTTVMNMGSRGGYGDVELRDSIDAGIVAGPRMQVAGEELNQRASSPVAARSASWRDSFTQNQNINSPWLGRAAVRENKLHGVDWIKIYTTQDFVGRQIRVWKPDGTMINSPSLTYEEVEAIVDEAHRLGLKVACHTYGGEGQRSCIRAGVDAPNHITDLDDESLRLLVEKRLPIVMTIDDLIVLHPGDMEATDGRNSRLKMAEQSVRKAMAAGVPIVFGSGAVGANIRHGEQARQFPVLVKWGMTPAQALQTAYRNAANLLNYDWANHVGSLEKGKFADIIAVPGNPLDDITEMQRVAFVMKGGRVYRDSLSAGMDASRSTARLSVR